MSFYDNVLSLIARVLPAKTVDSVVAGATKFLTALAAVEAAQNAKIAKGEATISEVAKVVALAKAERERAERIAAKVAEIFG